MKALPFFIVIVIVAHLITGCQSRPTVTVVQNSLFKGALKNKKVAVGGLTASDAAVYPGQAQEMKILSDAGTVVQRRLSRSRVLSVDAAWGAAGWPSTKVASGVPVVLGRQLTKSYVRNARSKGIDYLLWIDLTGNSVSSRSGQWQMSRTDYPTCSCGKIGDSPCQSAGSSSCSSRCCSSCRKGNTVTEHHHSVSASRRVGADYSLLDTNTEKPVWRANVVLSRAAVNDSMSESGSPSPPMAPLPPEESLIMRRMTKAVIGRLPK